MRKLTEEEKAKRKEEIKVYQTEYYRKRKEADPEYVKKKRGNPENHKGKKPKPGSQKALLQMYIEKYGKLEVENLE